MRNPVTVTVNSITTKGEQTLILDGADGEEIRGKKVLIIDDVISTGESLAAVEKLVEKFDADIVGKAAILPRVMQRTETISFSSKSCRFLLNETGVSAVCRIRLYYGGSSACLRVSESICGSYFDCCRSNFAHSDAQYQEAQNKNVTVFLGDSLTTVRHDISCA